MRLNVFDCIDETLDSLKQNNQLYHEAESEIKQYLLSLFEDDSDMIVDIFSRVKSKESLREKIIRNRFYLKYQSGDEILQHLSDLVGLTIECRFIEEEYKVLRRLREIFTIVHEHGFYSSEQWQNIFLQIQSHQPQVQKNGLAIYRIDGYIVKNEMKINFELQIKALVHAFWGDIEHKLVYKNTNFYVYDDFMKDILTSINANLAIIDRQLSIVYNQIQNSSVNDMSISEASFEKLITKAINDLFAIKMSESIGFAINLKRTSAILGHYIFIKDIRDSVTNNDRISALFKTFKKINNATIDFENTIQFEGEFYSSDPFIHRLGNYLISVLNIDYDWYVFFKMLFFIEPGNDSQDFSLFLKIIKNYLVDDYWFKTSFVKLSMEDSLAIQDRCIEFLADSLCSIGTIEIIHDDKMIEVNKQFVYFIQELEERVIDLHDFNHYERAYYEEWLNRIRQIF